MWTDAAAEMAQNLQFPGAMDRRLEEDHRAPDLYRRITEKMREMERERRNACHHELIEGDRGETLRAKSDRETT